MTTAFDGAIDAITTPMDQKFGDIQNYMDMTGGSKAFDTILKAASAMSMISPAEDAIIRSILPVATAVLDQNGDGYLQFAEAGKAMKDVLHAI